MEQSIGDAMGFDRAITLFSPDGRLLQVEYAKKTVLQGSAAVGVIGKNAVVFVADKRLPEEQKLIIPESIEKIFKIDDHVGSAISGLIADARMLVEKAQVEAQQYKVTFNEPADILLMVKQISSDMQTFTQYGGARPYGVSLLMGGLKGGVPVLYMLDPSGIFFQYKALSIGDNSSAINKSLEEGYKPDMDIDGMIKLAIRALKAGGIKPQIERFEIATIDASGFKKLDRDQVSKYL